jgi:acetyl-CoA carboxylase carboxyl transferase subunit alpha
VELHGDRSRADDGALVTGIGKLDGRTVVLVGHQKGRDVKERIDRQFGMAYPEGYAKAMRAMDLAERFGFPFVALVDTPGAYPGVAAEQHGQGGAIARSQAQMARLTVPTVSCVIGEGGSGGAVAIAVADRVLMQENAIYSVISPEGCAAILWRDAGEAKKAAAAFKPDAVHCLELGVVDAIVPEPPGGAHTDHDEAARLLAGAVGDALRAVADVDGAERRHARHRKFRTMGVFLE